MAKASLAPRRLCSAREVATMRYALGLLLEDRVDPDLDAELRPVLEGHGLITDDEIFDLMTRLEGVTALVVRRP